MGEGHQGRRHRRELSAARRWLAAGLAAALAAGAGAAAAEARKGKGRASGAEPVRVEKLACKLGTDEHHARIAVELANGRVREFAYYSIWKPRTCSLHVERGDAYSKWEEFKTVTTVTLAEEKGAVLIDHEPGKYKFIFREIDRMRYCGAEGKVSGSLTITRGKAQCELEGVMDDDPSKQRPPEAEAVPQKEPPQAGKDPDPAREAAPAK